MDLLKKLEKDKNRALKSKDKDRLSVLRLAIAAVKNKEIEKRPEELVEDDVLDVIAKEIKDREEAIPIYQDAGSEDRVEKLKTELEVLREYLPKMDSEKLESLVSAAIEKTGAESPEDFGKVMGAVMPQVKGQASPEKVKQLIQQKLTSKES